MRVSCDVFLQFSLVANRNTERESTRYTFLMIFIPGGSRGGLLCGHNGRDACRNFQKQLLKVTNMGVAPAYFDP